MPRDWPELFVIADGPSAIATGEPEPEERHRGFFRRLRENMAKTRQALAAEVQATLFEDLDAESWERLEEALIMADVGAATTARVVAQLEAEAGSGELEGGAALTQRLVELMADIARGAPPPPPPSPLWFGECRSPWNMGGRLSGFRGQRMVLWCGLAVSWSADGLWCGLGEGLAGFVVGGWFVVRAWRVRGGRMVVGEGWGLASGVWFDGLLWLCLCLWFGARLGLIWGFGGRRWLRMLLIC
jgi:hypothetical protein